MASQHAAALHARPAPARRGGPPLAAALAGFLLAALPSTAQAALILENDGGVAGPHSGDGFNLTVDSTSGLKWLDLTITRGMSRNQVLASDLIVGGDYRYATDVEVAGLFFNNVGIALAAGTQNTPSFAGGGTIALGTTLINALGVTNTQIPLGSYGLVDSATTLSVWNTYAIRVFTLPAVGLLRFSQSDDAASSGAFGFGSFLVQVSAETGEAPEPDALALLGLAFAGLVRLRRRRPG